MMRKASKILLALFLVLVAILFWWSMRPSSPDERYEKHFDPYIIQTTPRGLTEESDNYMMGAIHYKEHEYRLAITKFVEHLAETPKDYRARLMLGVSYMALKEYSEAEPIFIDLAEDPNHLFQDQAKWYLGLLYLVDSDEANDTKASDYFDGIRDKRLRDKADQMVN